MSEWREVLLEDVADELTVGYVGPMASEYVPTGIPFLRSQNVEPLRVNQEDIKFITPEFHERIRKSALTPGDVVIVRTGKPGACTVMPDWLPVSNCSDLVIVRCGENLDARFLAYYVNTVASHHVSAHLVGAVQQHFNVGSARKLKMLLPSLSEQRAIASVLGGLDDKIELNRRMNETLEAMARALFQNWFVDAAQAGLPKGWRMGKLRECCERVENGGTPSRNVPAYWQPQEVPWLTSGEVRQKIVAATESFISRAGLENSSAKLWQKETTVVALYGATAGQVTLLGSEMCSNQACCALIPKSGWRFYVYLHTSSSIQALEQQVRGSAQQNLSQQIVADLPTLLPDEQTIAKFDFVVTPLIERWICNLFESRTLAALRDALLPKLLSGELRVPTIKRGDQP